jgi:hypothetical protein
MGEYGKVLSLGAVVGQLGAYVGTGAVSEEWEAQYGALTEQLAAEVAKKTIPDSGILDILSNLVSYDEKSLQEVPKELGNIVRSGVTAFLIPGSGQFKFFRDMLDEHKRETGAGEGESGTTIGGSEYPAIIKEINTLLNKLPGTSRELPEVRDTLGYKIEHKRFRPLTSFDENEIRKNPVVKEIARLSQGPDSIVPFKLADKWDKPLRLEPMPWTIKVPGTPIKYNLTPREREEIQLRSLGKVKGQFETFEEAVQKELLKHPMSDLERKTSISGLFNGWRKREILNFLNTHKNEITEKAREYGTAVQDLLKKKAQFTLEDMGE